MPTIEMYTTGVCPYCINAKRLLQQRGVGTIDERRVDLNPTLMQEMIRRSQRRTVPQIFIGERHIGGFDDLSALDRAGGLVLLLQAA